VQEKQLQAKRKLADATNAIEPGVANKKQKIKGRSDEEEEEISLIARKFTIMTLFWLHDDKQVFRTQVDEQYDPLQRFENKGNKIQGQLADLLGELPSAYVEMVSKGETAWLSQKVRPLFTALDLTCTKRVIMGSFGMQ
jgi:hypothetical protein